MIYKDGNRKDLEETLVEITEIYEKEGVIVGGDFNTRIGELHNIEVMSDDFRRKSKDKIISNGGRKLIDLIHDKGWYILNGNREGDWEGEYTYVGAHGSTVIDYTFVNENVNDFVTKFNIGERVDSDHMPMITEIEVEESTDGNHSEIGEEDKE